MSQRLRTMDEMDACVFSSDMLYNDEERAEFKSMVARWVRALGDTESPDVSHCKWVGLTDEEVKHLYKESRQPGGAVVRTAEQIFNTTCRAIEARLKEKNT